MLRLIPGGTNSSLWKTSRRHSDQMLKPPHLTSFNTEKQRFYSGSIRNDWAPHPIPKNEGGRTFLPMCLQKSFGHHPHLVNRQLRLTAQLSLWHNRPVQGFHQCKHCLNLPVNLPLHSTPTSELRSLDTIPTLFTLSFWLRRMVSDLEVPILLPAASHGQQTVLVHTDGLCSVRPVGSQQGKDPVQSWPWPLGCAWKFSS